MNSNPDYIIVGGGSAGAVLANRLSEDPGTRVLLLEAGGNGRDFLIQMPAGIAKLMNNPRYDWMYKQEPDPTVKDREFIWNAGRMLGGGSSINGQVHIRGTRGDYDNWERLGATGWNYDSCVKYFVKSEDFGGEPSPCRGQGGPLSVQPMREPHRLTKVFLQACAEAGLPTLPDYADGQMDGAFQVVASQRNGWRCSTEKAYLRPARSRSNLEIKTGVKVERVIFEGLRAVGVEASIDGNRQIFKSNREVIISAGTMGSPALLLRSGIGPAEDLRGYGRDVVFDSPEVGKNLVEHLGIGITKYVNVSTYNSETGPLHLAGHLAKLFLAHKGAMANPVAQALALARSTPGLVEPDIQLHFLALAYSTGASGATMDKAPAVSTFVNICRPNSKGEILLAPDAAGGIRIRHQFLSDPRDMEILVNSCKLIERIYATGSWQTAVTGDRTPIPLPATDAEWQDYIRSNSAPIYHPAGSCRMGSDQRSVVLPDTSVRGVSGLRVADASIMPALVSANTNAASIMIGEKAADLVKGLG